MAVRYLPDFLLGDKIIKALYTELLSETGRFRGNVEDLKNQLFIETATWGLNLWEKFLDLPTDESKSYLDRRSVIKSKLRGYGTVTKQLIQDVAQAYLNGEVEVDEFKDAFTVGIKFVGKRGNPPNMSDIQDAIRTILPAHLAIVFEFTYAHWDEIQLILQELFNDLDDMTWDSLETVIT